MQAYCKYMYSLDLKFIKRETISKNYDKINHIQLVLRNRGGVHVLYNDVSLQIERLISNQQGIQVIRNFTPILLSTLIDIV